jgi:hypothetical protein
MARLVVDHLQDLVLKTEDVKAMLDELAEFSAVTLADPTIAFWSVTLIQRMKPSDRGQQRSLRGPSGRNAIQCRRWALPGSKLAAGTGTGCKWCRHGVMTTTFPRP